MTLSTRTSKQRKGSRHNVGWGWNGDSEWEYRKTLTKDERDHFDYVIDDRARWTIVNRWLRERATPE
jgi:hypothetical protein